MCGITAIVSKDEGVFPFLFQSLENLQNRGYDSAGICGVNQDAEFVLRKRASDDKMTALQKLKMEGEHAFNDCFIGIAHTRWATHGEKNDVNSHPHVCYRNKVALVHNGIIENYATLKSELMSKGINFKSATDSEVVVNLISYLYTQMSFKKAIKKAIEMLKGTWALAIISVDCNMLYFTRHGSPLVMVHTDKEVIVTSEVSGLFTKTKSFQRYTCVVEGKLYKMSPESIIDCEMKDINFSQFDVSPYPYEHWTMKEINEQANINRTINFGGRVGLDGNIYLGGLNAAVHRLEKATQVYILGCGTSYHAGMIGEVFFKKYCRTVNVKCLNVAEFDHNTIYRDFENTVVICVSQSGETQDLIKCLKICKQQGVMTIGVVNVIDSYIARETMCGVYCNAGREVAVASTKSFTSQVMVMILISLWFNQHHSKCDAQDRIPIITQLYDFTSQTKNVLEQLQNISYDKFSNVLNQNSMFILGSKGSDYVIALEGALKFKETCYVHCEGTYTGSLKHGPFALICDKFPIICLVTDKSEWSSISNAIEEIRSRKGHIVVIGNHPNADIPIETDNEFGFLWNNMALQLLAYHLATSKGINPDIPKNLAKVVTVG